MKEAMLRHGWIGKGKASIALPAFLYWQRYQCRTTVVRRAGDCPPYPPRLAHYAILKFDFRGRAASRIAMKSFCLTWAVLMGSLWQTPAAIIAENGLARTVIVVDPAATATEMYAARQLASTLQQITGATFEMRTNTESPARAIMVGTGAAAAAAFPEAPLAQLGGEELIIRTEGDPGRSRA